MYSASLHINFRETSAAKWLNMFFLEIAWLFTKIANLLRAWKIYEFWALCITAEFSIKAGYHKISQFISVSTLKTWISSLIGF